jgi:hypothetical protein
MKLEDWEKRKEIYFLGWVKNRRQYFLRRLRRRFVVGPCAINVTSKVLTCVTNMLTRNTSKNR